MARSPRETETEAVRLRRENAKLHAQLAARDGTPHKREKSRLHRFWDRTVLAAAMGASIAGATAGGVAWLQYEQAQAAAAAKVAEEECGWANAWLADEAVNPYLSEADKTARTKKAQQISDDCPRRR